MKSFRISRLKENAIIPALTFIVLCVYVGCIDSGPQASKKIEAFREDGKLEFVNYDGKVCASIVIEIADTSEARARGLMGRKAMDDRVGMLFVYDRADGRVFWMRNTPMPLDIIFVSENREVINIAERTEPLSDNRCRSKAPAKYVVEVMSGFSERHGIGEGTRVRWRRF